MRLLAPVLLLGFALTAGAAEIWRWTDANGVVHYSDHPQPGAERVQVSAPKPSGDGPVPEMPPDVAPREPREASFAYAQCNVATPQADETFHSVQPVTISLDVQPGLMPGHRVEAQMNGVRLTGWPPGSLSYTVPEVFRGSHTVQVRIVDAGGAVLCTGEPRTFHLRQQSVLAPAGAVPRPAPRPAPAPAPAPGPRPAG